MVLCFFFGMAPFYAQAETVVRTGQNIAIEAEQTVDGNYYVSVGPFSDTVMSGTIKGDMYALGGVVTVNGTIANDLTIVGGSTQIHGSVAGDVRVVAGEVTIADHVGGDLFVMGGVLNVLSTAKIDGDIIFYGGTATIAGTVNGSIVGTSEKIRIDARVHKNVDIKTAQLITLGDTAVVDGYVTYASGNPIERGQNTIVKGELHKVDTFSAKAVDESRFKPTSLIPAFIVLFTTLTVYLLFRKKLETLVLRTHSTTLKVSLLGFCALLFGPLLAVVMMLTGLGLLIGGMTLLLLLCIYILGYVLAGVIFGSYLAKSFTNHPKVTLYWVLIGTLTLQVLLFIPILGVVTLMCFVIMAIGSLLFGIYSLAT